MTFPSHHCDDSDRFLRGLAAVGVGALLVLGIARAALFLAAALCEIPDPNQPFHLEGSSVYFAWRAEHGQTLYPRPEGATYTVNYMGPCYFWLVGAIGRLLGADIAGLHVIGRVVTFLCGLGPAIIAAAYLARRYGRWIGAVGFVFGLGSAPMVAYGVMSRPDMMADLLGAAGFFMACRRDRRSILTAAVVLALACLTKQTAVVWLLAAMAAILFQKGTRHFAILLGATAAAIVLLAVWLLTATSEPNLRSSILSQGALPFDFQQQVGILILLLRRSPEMLFFVLVGCGLWMSGSSKNRDLFILASLWFLAAIVMCAKKGSDLNYFLPLRMIEALAAGTLCVAALRTDRRRAGWAFLALVAAVTMVPSTAVAVERAGEAIRRFMPSDNEIDVVKRRQFEQLILLAKDPDVRWLTDSDRLAVYQGPRAAFFDCFLFRLQVDAGQIDSRELIQRINSRWYEYVVLSADVEGDYNDVFFYRLPAPVADAVKANYRLQSREAGLFVYIPRCDVSETPLP